MASRKKETIEFNSVPENLRNDLAKTVCALRQLGFDVGVGRQYKEGSVECESIKLARKIDAKLFDRHIVGKGAQYGIHSVEIPPLTLNYGFFPKTYWQEKLFYIQDDLIDFVLNADGQTLDKILNRKNTTISKDIEGMILQHSINRRKLSDLSGVGIDE
jgi:hypothetical protein